MLRALSDLLGAVLDRFESTQNSSTLDCEGEKERAVSLRGKRAPPSSAVLKGMRRRTRAREDEVELKRPPDGHLHVVATAAAILETEGDARSVDDLARELIE